MTLQQLYNQQIQARGMEYDQAQFGVVEQLQVLSEQLLEPRAGSGNSFLDGLLRRRQPAPPPIEGIYAWGGVGRGKTWLLDLFYNHLPFEDKLRVHFHRFMRNVHEELAELKGCADPLAQVATRLAAKTRILCLDEFFVSDIGDAMILAQLLHALFEQKVPLVTTSNTEPDNLYRNGLQRARFLPAIALLNQHTRVMELNGPTDYRLRFLEHARIYHTPLGDQVYEALDQEFESLAPEKGRTGGSITVYNRPIPVQRVADDVVWFDFMDICGPPRSQADYLDLARGFHTVLISDIPALTSELDDATRRFLYLLDEFYDRKVKLIISAAHPPESLYQGQRLAFEFQRAESRLLEMQSAEYLAMEHKA
ncbi:MAG: cell division protein ZapE [Gammaproteobacteria bacterium]|nr:cell division protein ZapE [Gammaproteobacteria bacterium]